MQEQLLTQRAEHRTFSSQKERLSGNSLDENNLGVPMIRARKLHRNNYLPKSRAERRWQSANNSALPLFL
jgi:hypothetical protein